MSTAYLSLKPLVSWLYQSRPISWREVFGRKAPLELEIGFGLGDFLVRLSRSHPERDFVGIDWEWKMARRALRKIALARVGNARVVKVDARMALRRLFMEKSISRAYVLFPCPWPKRRHEGRRLLRHSFLRLLNSRMVDGAEVVVVTDYAPYAEWIASEAVGTGFDMRVEKVGSQYQTKYERKWEAEGKKQFYELLLVKERHVFVPLEEEIPLKTYKIQELLLDRLPPPNSTGEIRIEFKEKLYDPMAEKAMVRAVVVEDGLIQHFWVEIVKEEGGWRIRPAKGCGWVPTLGVQRALDLVHGSVSREGTKGTDEKGP